MCIVQTGMLSSVFALWLYCCSWPVSVTRNNHSFHLLPSTDLSILSKGKVVLQVLFGAVTQFVI